MTIEALKIAIVGTGEGYHEAKNLDSSWTIWQLNGVYDFPLPFAKHFELHDYATLKASPHLPAYYDFLEKSSKEGKLVVGTPCMKEQYPDAILYPVAEVVNFYNLKYLTSTAALLLAYAIMQNPSAIAIRGVNLADDTEYFYQRPCAEFYLGFAMARGIKLSIPESCPMLYAAGIYGIESHYMQNTIDSKVALLQQEREKMKKAIFDAQISEAYYSGGLDMAKYITKSCGLKSLGLTNNIRT